MHGLEYWYQLMIALRKRGSFFLRCWLPYYDHTPLKSILVSYDLLLYMIIIKDPMEGLNHISP